MKPQDVEIIHPPRKPPHPVIKALATVAVWSIALVIWHRLRHPMAGAALFVMAGGVSWLIWSNKK